jgi:hypothetical protein
VGWLIGAKDTAEKRMQLLRCYGGLKKLFFLLVMIRHTATLRQAQDDKHSAGVSMFISIVTTYCERCIEQSSFQQ